MSETPTHEARVRHALHAWRSAVRRAVVASATRPAPELPTSEARDPLFPPLDLPVMPAQGDLAQMIGRLLDGEEAARLRELGLDPLPLAAGACAQTLAATNRTGREAEPWPPRGLPAIFAPERISASLRRALERPDLPAAWRHELQALLSGSQGSSSGGTPLMRRAAADGRARPRMLAHAIPVPGAPGWSVDLDLHPAVDGGWVAELRRSWQGAGEAPSPPALRVQLRDARSEVRLALDLPAARAEAGGWLDQDPGKDAVVVVQLLGTDGADGP